MNRPITPISKESQLKNSPGWKKKQEKLERTKGQRLEKEVAQKLGGRVNNQRQHGSINNPDVSFGRFHIETKAGNISIRRELDEISLKTPSNCRPALVFLSGGTQWIALPFNAVDEFCHDRLDKLGYYAVPYREDV